MDWNKVRCLSESGPFRIGSMILLATEDWDSPTDAYQEFLDSVDSELETMFGETPDCIEDLDMLWEWLADTHKLGLIARVEVPVKQFHHIPSKAEVYGVSYSWGHYYTKWVYAETLQGIIDEASKLCSKWHEKDRVHNESR